MNITVIGAGVFGTALGNVLIGNGHRVIYYDPKLPLSLAESLEQTEAVLIVTPSQFVADTITKLENYPKRPTIIASKGLFSPDITSSSHISALAGAGFAEKINQKHPTILTASDPLAKSLLENDFMKIEIASDPASILFCGAIKNVYAIGSGLLGLDPKTSLFANYIEKSLRELKTALKLQNLDQSTADYSCGIADLIMTCASRESRNYSFGQQLSQDSTFTPDYTAEGLTTINNLPRSISNLPIIATIHDIIHQKSTTKNLTEVILNA